MTPGSWFLLGGSGKTDTVRETMLKTVELVHV